MCVTGTDMQRELCIAVPAHFANAWFEHEATAEERGALLDFACSLPRAAHDDADRLRRIVEDATRGVAAERVTALEKDRDAHRAAALEAQAKLAAAERAAGMLEQAAENKVRTLMEAEVRDMRHELAALSAAKVEREQTLSAKLQDNVDELQRLAAERVQLQLRVAELETPMARGKAGEFDVAKTLTDVGFHVEDTSMGDCKLQGYLDLLVWPAGREEGMRIAIECKNCAAIDPKTHLDVFAAKSRDGFKRGLFDSSIFVSLRAHTKRGAESVALELFADDSGRPSVPVSFVGPERGKTAPPLLQEQLESHVCLHAAFLAQMRQKAASGEERTDADAMALHELVALSNEELNGTFDDLNRQTRLLKDMQTLNTSVRSRCIRLFSAVWKTNASIPWLHAPMEAPWMPAFEALRVRKEADPGIRDATLWNNAAKDAKAVIEKHVGHEAVFHCLKKRPRDD